MLILDDDKRRRAYFLASGHDAVGSLEDFMANIHNHDQVSLDYDLYRENLNKGLTGNDAAKFLAEIRWPGKVVVHSHNAVGALRIAKTLLMAGISFKIRPFPIGA